MLCKEGEVALQSFVATAVLFLVLFIPPTNVNTLKPYEYNQYANPILYYIAVNMILRILYCKHYQVAIRAAFLGQMFALGFYVFLLAPQQVYIFGIYMAVMAFFHYSEYMTVSVIKPKELSTKSFMLSHSPAYIAAAATSWIEFALESYFLPDLKAFPYVPYIGFIICILGELIRKLAMFTAAKNFNHLVQYEKATDHTLVTHGIYSWSRHPSYVGWFYWSIATQVCLVHIYRFSFVWGVLYKGTFSLVILLNPVCIVIYTIVSWMFFKERIYCEEITLLHFFGQQYINYQQKVGTGLPFIKGYFVKI